MTDIVVVVVTDQAGVAKLHKANKKDAKTKKPPFAHILTRRADNVSDLGEAVTNAIRNAG